MCVRKQYLLPSTGRGQELLTNDMFNLFNNQSSCFKAIDFLQIFYQTLYIYTFIILLNILSSRIWGDFPPLHLLGFGRFSAIPSFHHSIILCYRVALHSWHATYASVNSTCAQPPRATVGYLPTLSVPGVGHLQILHCPGAGHLPTPGPFPSFWHARGFLSRTGINCRGL